ncbi:MAG: PEP-CTERM sorting domain-containing protein [Phycisphaerae bacterium]|nr:PEP-CTERM sorting domain-containing protein [Phycisphaerae bacterium]
MKNAIIIYILFVCLFACPGWGAYTYEVYTYGESKTLNGTESILIDQQGGMYGLTLTVDSSATINGTSTLAEGSGGIWEINLTNNSSLTMSGGQVHEISIGNGNAIAVLNGGLIEAVYSYQTVNNPHITLYYSGDLPTVQEIGGFDYLVGQWGDSTGFSIYLHNTGYDTYENFDFILVPEPATLALLGLGSLLIRQKK